MSKYFNLFKNLLIIVLCIIILKQFGQNRQLSRINAKIIKQERKKAQEIIDKKEKEILDLKDKIVYENELIDESIELFNQLSLEKSKVETLYVEKVQKINTIDANELKEYFYEEFK